MNFFDIIQVVVWDYLWGTPMVVFILAAGVYLTVRSGFFQFRFFGRAMKQTFAHFFGKKKGESEGDGIISPLQAISTALGSTIGTGNIGGVATAVVTGGPGAVFWMWVAGLFGMLIKMVEITLAVHYRAKDEKGDPYGGPTYYMKRGLAEEKGLKRFALVLTILFICGFFMGFFINIQTYTISEAIATTFHIGMVPVAVVYSVILFVMICGGLKRVGEWCSILVPFMCLVYLGGGLIILLMDAANLPGLFALVFRCAFTPQAALGGFAGFTVMQALKVGMARSVFSNEAGWGTAPMIHASAKVDHPVKQGMLGIFEVFVDTFVVCTITALVVIHSGLWNTGLDGAELTLSAFEMGLGVAGRWILALGVLLFGITTASGIYVQSEVIFRGIIKNPRICKRVIKAYKLLYPLNALAMVFIAVYYGMPGTILWICSDACTAFPILTNMIALLILSPRFLSLVKDYKARRYGIGQIDPSVKIFYED